MKAKLADFQQKWSQMKLTKAAAFWVAIAAIALTVYLGFAQAGWVTDGTAQQMAQIAAQSAIVDRLAPICVIQFNEDSQRTQNLEDFKALASSFQRAAYVKEQGWATMPGEAKPDDKVATECVQQLLLISE